MYRCLSWLLELPVCELPNPMSLPPVVLVVRNQTSLVHREGEAVELVEATPAPAEPAKEAAVSGVPRTAPGAPHVTAPVTPAVSRLPELSYAREPLCSPRRQ